MTLVGGLALSIGAFVIELARALGGHRWSWLYVVEWPIFAIFGIYVWWVLLHGRDRAPARAESTTSSAAPDEALDAWTRYLAVMEAAESEDVNRPQ